VISFEQHLRNSAVSRELLNTFLDPSSGAWAKFDPELGYTVGNSLPRNGMDGCLTISTTQENGARTARMYTDLPCRINTYGDSFTECHQVSDGETWQEYLAAHLGEPIRNFGVGGYGVYQAYRRMVRTESSGDGAANVLLYVWGDDHLRSLMRCRHAAIYPWWDHQGGLFFHNNFWSHLEMDLSTARFVDRPNLLPDARALYRMCDPDFMYRSLRDDLMLQLCLLEHVDPSSIDPAPLHSLADCLGVTVPRGERSRVSTETAELIGRAYGFAATRHIIDRASAFCRAHGKKLLLLLQCPTATGQVLRGEPRYDREIVDFIRERRIRFFDMNEVHGRDYRSFNLSTDDYMKRYHIGHYNPRGNHLFAYALKDLLVDVLEPKPLTYRGDARRPADCRDYLPK